MQVKLINKIFVSRHNQKIDTALRSLRALRENWLTVQRGPPDMALAAVGVDDVRTYKDAQITGMVSEDIKAFKDAQLTARRALSELTKAGFSSTRVNYQEWYARFGQQIMDLATNFQPSARFYDPDNLVPLPVVQLNFATLLDPAYSPQPDELTNKLRGIKQPAYPSLLRSAPPEVLTIVNQTNEPTHGKQAIPEWLHQVGTYASASVEIPACREKLLTFPGSH